MEPFDSFRTGFRPQVHALETDEEYLEAYKRWRAGWRSSGPPESESSGAESEPIDGSGSGT
ncbi:hypothetical protein GCM10008101_06840 [Lysobacter xinjiangensis]|uniref:Uncharacterized protein n=1 Tax=Cognatilysobacter xinjiangensis TaxID=546892 RepID=A0ABQ3BTA2_9GAMM|nr:hypothetical protein [Lysobacter xinjiangensis]GGZ56064.1 hypothetical protein GCM10008101_06840 [Lysobacter xinjiangensis]